MKRFAWLLLSGCLPFTGAWAACESIATAPANFGDVPSTGVRSTAQSASTLNAGLRCTGAVLSVLASTDRFQLTVTPSSGGLVGPSGDVIGYTLFADSARSFPITRGVTFEYARTGLLEALGLLNGSTPKSVPLYLHTVVGSNVAAGLYQETLTLAWNWNYCSAIGIGNLCTGRDTGARSQQLTVSMRVTNDCQIVAPAVSFGSAPVVGEFATVRQSISVACTKGSNYSVGLDDGLAAAGGRRRMANGAGGFIAYDLYKGASTLRWGNQGAARRASGEAEVNGGVGTGIGSQVFNYNAKVYTDQATPPEGRYRDSVVLDVQF